MLSYVFENKRLKVKEISEYCKSHFEFSTIRNEKKEVFLANKWLSVIISNRYTRILLRDENVNIQYIEKIF